MEDSSTGTKALKMDDTAKGRTRANTVLSLYVTMFLHTFAVFLSFDSKMLIYLKHFNGETAKYALLNAKAMTIMMGSTLILQPWLIFFCEAYGRKSLLRLSVVSSILARLADALFPRPKIIFLTTAASSLGHSALLAAQSIIGDLFAGEHQRIGGALTKMMIGPAAAMVVAPTLGSSLAMRNVRLPFILAIFAGLLEFSLVQKLPETLTSSQRVAFKDLDLRKMNPFSCFRIFSRDVRLSGLALAQFISEVTAPPLVSRTTNLVYQESFHWNLASIGRFSSIQNIIRIPGMALGGRAVEAFGEVHALLCGSSATLLHMMLDSSFVRTPFQQYVTTPLVALNGLNVASLKGLLQQAGADAGMRQAELQGCLSALQGIAMMIGGPIWAAWYAACLRKGQPRRFFNGTILCVILQTLVSQVAARLPRPSKVVSNSCSDGQR